MCKILLIREHYVNVLPERVYLNGDTAGFQSQIQKVRVTKLTHSPGNHPITALDMQGRHARGEGRVSSLFPHMSPSHAPFFLLSAYYAGYPCRSTSLVLLVMSSVFMVKNNFAVRLVQGGGGSFNDSAEEAREKG